MIRHLLSLLAAVPITHLNVLLVLGIVLFVGSFGGRIFQKLRIPQVVGYITIGILIGQSGARIIGADLLQNLAPFSSFALAIIGFMIGGELQIAVIRKYGRQFTYILLLEALTAFVFVSIVTAVLGLLVLRDVALSVSLGLLVGAMSSATAPAATTDVLWENKTRGPLTTMVLGIVAMDDGVALLLYAVAASVASSLLGRTSGSLAMSVASLLYETGAALLLGLLFGVILQRVIRGFVDESRTLAFSLGAILLLIGITQTINVNTILAAMAMGFYIVNYVPRKSEETFRLVERFAPPIYVLFFVLVGAKLNIWVVSPIVAAFAAVYLVGRTGGKFLGSYLGSRLSAAAASVRRYLPFCLFSQAGVAIGLSIVAGNAFPGTLGNMILTIITATTFVVQVIGPPFVKYAVTRAGEVGLNVTEEDLIRASRARDVADTAVPVIDEHASIARVLSTVSDSDALAYPVVDRGGRPVGVVTVEHLKSTFMAAELSEVLVAHDIMEPVVSTCRPEDAATDVEKDLRQRGIDAMPMVDGDSRVLGMVERRHIQRFVSRKLLEAQARAESLG